MMELIAATVIILHGPDRHEIRVNPRQVTALHSPRPGAKKGDKLYDESINCLVNMTDGKHVAVIETCVHVEHLLHEATK